MITLNENNLKELNNFIQEMPTKYGVPLIQFLNKLIEDQKASAEIDHQELSEIRETKLG
jgi:hypothetical protein